MDKTLLQLNPDQLRNCQNTADLPFKTTAELKPFSGMLGQRRAAKAMDFGVNMRQRGYNIYVMGESGTGKASYVKYYLHAFAHQQKAGRDWVYVSNFENQREPKAIGLPASMANQLKKDIEQLVDQLLLTFPSAFDNLIYQQKKSRIEQVFNQRYSHAVERVEQAGVRRQIALCRDNGALHFTPVKEGKSLDEAAFADLSDAEREKINTDVRALEEQLNEALVELPKWKRESTKALKLLNHQTVDEALQPLYSPLESGYSQQPEILNYLAAMKSHLHRSVFELLMDERSDSHEDPSKRQQLIDWYVPNVLVSHTKDSPAPVIFEPHPTYKNLFGCTEYISEMGSLVTNYQQIRTGSLHRANGGYLILEANKVLEEYGVWDALKRAQKNQEIKIEPPNSEWMNSVNLAPEVVPLQVKIILIGDTHLYYCLQDLDPEFQKLFRVLVDFDDDLKRTPDSVHDYARLLQHRSQEEGYACLSADAVACMVEASSRLADHQHRLSTRVGDLFDLLAEADFLCKAEGNPLLERSHVEQAINAKNERTGRIRDDLQNDMLQGNILIETEGESVGKINGLTVLDIGDSSFGQPARITATVYPGTQGIVDIEREVALGQAIHSKGVMILSGYLGSRYARQFPLAISANIAMEQSYGYIDGDSASLAELCCLISALTHIPLRQNLAITGSINQHGEVQPIGGVNEKIEGFFRLCKAKGVKAQHGVIIPHSNRLNLMLSQEVIDSAQAGHFVVYAVRTVDEALALLTGKEAGTMSHDGTYPLGSINHKVVTALKKLSTEVMEKTPTWKRRHEP